MQIIQIVRRFAPVGGMERYVWELVAALASKSVDIIVICELCADRQIVPPGVQIIELGCSRMPFSWLRLLGFSRTVRKVLKSFKSSCVLVHSHERTSVHHVTTFHGPPFAKIREFPWYRRLSPRVWAYLWMEYCEVCASQVRVVVPNSSLIKKSLEDFYPNIGGRLAAPVIPGVEPVPERAFRVANSKAGVIGFVGKEWKRKGFAFFLKIARSLLSARPALCIMIIGPQEQEIASLLKDYPGKYLCEGWKDAKPCYQLMDLLLHPASSEPYGMVVAEAMAAKVPVIISDVCGVAADVTRENGTVLSLTRDIAVWVEECDRWLSAQQKPLGYARPWEQVANQYIEIYEEVYKSLV